MDNTIPALDRLAESINPAVAGSSLVAIEFFLEKKITPLESAERRPRLVRLHPRPSPGPPARTTHSLGIFLSLQRPWRLLGNTVGTIKKKIDHSPSARSGAAVTGLPPPPAVNGGGGATAPAVQSGPGRPRVCALARLSAIIPIIPPTAYNTVP